MNDEHLPKDVRRVLNHLAHCRALSYYSQCRLRIQHEIDELLAQGLTAEQALEKLRTDPPLVDPGY